MKKNLVGLLLGLALLGGCQATMKTDKELALRFKEECSDVPEVDMQRIFCVMGKMLQYCREHPEEVGHRPICIDLLYKLTNNHLFPSTGFSSGLVSAGGASTTTTFGSYSSCGTVTSILVIPLL